MLILKIVLISIEIICGLLLIIVILLQKSKGEGLGLAFGSDMGEALFGAHAGNVLVKVTIWLGVIFLLNTAILAKIYTHGQSTSLMNKVKSSAPIERTAQPVSPVQPNSPYAQPADAPVGGKVTGSQPQSQTDY